MKCLKHYIVAVFFLINAVPALRIKAMQQLNAVLSYNIVQTTCKHNNDQSHAVYGKLNPTTVQSVVENDAFLLTVHSLLHILKLLLMCFCVLLI